MEKTTIGFYEEITLIGEKQEKKVTARVDTGATKSSIDSALTAELSLGPVVGTKLIKSAHGTSTRPLIRAKIDIAGKIVEGEFSIADRKHMKYPILVGQNIIKQGFIIDPDKK